MADLEEVTVGAVLERAVRLGPGDRLLSEPGVGSWTAADLLTDADRVARALLARHPPGTRIASLLLNGAESVLLQLGVARAGMVLVPLNPRLPSAEAARVLTVALAREVFVSPQVGDVAVMDLLDREDLPEGTQLVPCNGTMAGWFVGAGVDTALPPVGPSDLAQIQFTSGTSGPAKGVLISHGGMAATSAAFADRIGLGPGGAWVNPMPLFHTAGNVLGVLGSLWSRSDHVVLPFAPSATLRALADSSATLLSAAPTLLSLMLEEPDLATTDLTSLEVVFTGGQTVSPEFVDRVEKAFGARLSITFGMTETCGAVVQTSPHDDDRTRRTTVGRALAGTEVRVVDDGATVPRGTQGELMVRGARITRGYLDDPGATEAAIDAEGWLRTGDLAEMDVDGGLRVVGRAKDMIKTGGENLAPDVVEQHLLGHHDVLRAAVVGVPDERWGEVVVAFVVREQGDETSVETLQARLEAHCRAGLVPHAVPRRWFIVDDLPLTASSKVQRAALRQRAASALGQSSAKAGS